MNNALSIKPKEDPNRLKQIACDVNTEHAAFHSLHYQSLRHALRCGKLLREAKGLLAHGKFENWVNRNTELTPRTARHYMQIARGEKNLQRKSATVADLTVRKALEIIRDEVFPIPTFHTIAPNHKRPKPDFRTSTTVWNRNTSENRLSRKVQKFVMEDGRTGNRAGAMKDNPDELYSGTYSVFDVDLAKDIITRYAPDGCMVLDPFAGGPARGYAAAFLGCQYHGFDVRQEAIDDNRAYMKRHYLKGSATYYCGDARVLEGGPAKFGAAVTCPPYWDKEVYSKQPDDLSTIKNYCDFSDAMKEVAQAMRPRMNKGSFVCLVVGNFRDKGWMIDFRGNTVTNFEDAGFRFWEDVILDKPNGSAAVRAGNSWRGRKLVRTHEHLLVFKTP